MHSVRTALHIAIAVLIAPAPAILLLRDAFGDEPVPLVPAVASAVLSAMVYGLGVMLWYQARSDERTRTAAKDTVEGLAAQMRALERRERTAHHSFEDLPDPTARDLGIAPAQAMLWRVADIEDVHTLIGTQRVRLLTHWYRHVRRRTDGALEYGDWPAAADRIVLEQGLRLRTLARHDAIALITAEVALIAQTSVAAGGVAEQSGTTETARVRESRHLTGGAAAVGGSAQAQPAPAPQPNAAPATPPAGQPPPESNPEIAEQIVRCADDLTREGWTIKRQPDRRSGLDLIASQGETSVGIVCNAGDPLTDGLVCRTAAAALRHNVASTAIVRARKAPTSGPAQATAHVLGVAVVEEGRYGALSATRASEAGA
ncbi:MAG: hypothetical protein AAGI34_14905 [Pseudomonadota bacterium]